jgi:plastocyanin domain-containing protein
MKTIARNLAAVALAMALTAGWAGAGPQGAQRVKIAVTGRGFEPAVVRVQAGRPVILLVTRRTARTCATEFVLRDYGIHARLPLGETVPIAFTPRRPGELHYACAMDMIKGTIVVR